METRTEYSTILGNRTTNCILGNCTADCTDLGIVQYENLGILTVNNCLELQIQTLTVPIP